LATTYFPKIDYGEKKIKKRLKGDLYKCIKTAGLDAYLDAPSPETPTSRWKVKRCKSTRNNYKIERSRTRTAMEMILIHQWIGNPR